MSMALGGQECISTNMSFAYKYRGRAVKIATQKADQVTIKHEREAIPNQKRVVPCKEEGI